MGTVRTSRFDTLDAWKGLLIGGAYGMSKKLLAKSPAEWLRELRLLPTCGFRDRWAMELISIIKEAAKSKLQWGFDLADELSREGKWDADIWDALLGAWHDVEVLKRIKQ